MLEISLTVLAWLGPLNILPAKDQAYFWFEVRPAARNKLLSVGGMKYSKEIPIGSYAGT